MLDCVFGSCGHTILAYFGGDIAAAEKEAINCVVGRVLADCDVIETNFNRGIGGKGRDKEVEVGLVGAVEGESFV